MINLIKFEFDKSIIRKGKNFIEFWGTGMQLSRKKTAPILEPLVRAFNEYFFSPSNKLWIKRDFLNDNQNVRKAGKSLKMNLSFEEEKLRYLNYIEARAILKELKFSMLSLSEYWLALSDAKNIKDNQMIESLQGSNLVEFLDSAILDYSWLIEHPKILKEDGKVLLKGRKLKVTVPAGKPGLIHPDKINLKTGIPKEVRSPNEYGNKELWRYWEPDSPLVIPTRSYIFLLKQPCWDGKFHIEDSFPNLVIRPCCRNPPKPKVIVKHSNKLLTIKIIKGGDIHSAGQRENLRALIESKITPADIYKMELFLSHQFLFQYHMK